MNKFEFDKTMEVFGYEQNNYYHVEGLGMYHSGKYYVVVNGRTPVELAKKIYNKYDNSKYLIRVNGNSEFEKPKSDINTYHVDTIEGLVSLIYETKKYNLNEVENYDDILKSVYKNILKSVDTKINNYNWMLQNDNKDNYLDNLLTDNSYLDLRIRRCLEMFDNEVNPFHNMNLDKIDTNYMVGGDKTDEKESIILTDKDSRIELTNIKSKEGFLSKLTIPYEITYEDSSYSIIHYYTNNEEIVAFEKSDDDILRYEYNLTNKTYGEQYCKKHEATLAEKKAVIESIQDSIDLLEKLNRENIKRNFLKIKKKSKRTK